MKDDTYSPVKREFEELSRLARSVGDGCADAIEELAALFVEALRAGGRLYFAGNGGSAADAQHIATEYVVRFSKNREPLPATALTSDAVMLTACGNDLSFDEIFARQIEAFCTPKDVVILHSTSGNSANLIRAADVARRNGTRVVALLGKGGGDLRKHVDYAIVVPSDSTSHIQEIQLAIQHVVCDMVERGLGLT